MQVTDRNKRIGVAKAPFIVAGLLFLSACIDPFIPEIREVEDVMVINGRILDNVELQKVEVSITSPVQSNESFRTVGGCSVVVDDSAGRKYAFIEGEEGVYYCKMDSVDRLPGKKYKLTVITPGNRTYTSGFEEMLPCPPIDEIPWDYEEQGTSKPNVTYQGIQFYISTNAGGDFAENFLWELEETWKYSSSYAIIDQWDSIHQGYYEEEFIIDSVNGIFDTILTWVRTLDTVGVIWGNPEHPVDTLVYCYKHNGIPQVYTYSAKNISGGSIRKVPLNYVSDRTSRLSMRYSLLVRQFSLTETAYEFWKILDGQSKQSGELYGTQPVKIPGNIFSPDNPDERVLGLFYASAVTEKRIFINPMLKTVGPICGREHFTWDQLTEYLSYIHPDLYPIYLVRVGERDVDYVNQECIDCRLRGGGIKVPSYWEDR